MNDSSEERTKQPDILSTLIDSLDVECSTIEEIAVSPSRGRCTRDIGPVFYVVTEGSCRLLLPNTEPVRLDDGDLLLLPQGGEHGLSNSLSPSASLDNTGLQEPMIAGTVKTRGSALLLRGYLRHLAPKPHPLWLGLPHVVHLENSMDDTNQPVLANTIRSMRHLLFESSNGTNAILSLLGRLLVSEIIRKRVKWPELAGSGLSHALNDPELASVLTRVYRDPARQWTLMALAYEAGMSRSSFARHFKQLMGMPVMEWIVDLRMRLARSLLANPDLGLEQVASKVGYSSAASFSVAFKRWAGHYPSYGRGRSLPNNTPRLKDHSE